MKLGLILSLYLWVSIIFGVCASVDLLTWNIYGLIVDLIGIFIYSALAVFTLKAYLKNE